MMKVQRLFEKTNLKIRVYQGEHLSIKNGSENK